MPGSLEAILRRYSKAQRIGPESDLKRDLGLDSLQVVNLVVEIENAFGVEIDERSIRDLVTVGDVAARLQKMTGE